MNTEQSCIFWTLFIVTFCIETGDSIVWSPIFCNQMLLRGKKLAFWMNKSASFEWQWSDIRLKNCVLTAPFKYIVPSIFFEHFTLELWMITNKRMKKKNANLNSNSIWTELQQIFWERNQSMYPAELVIFFGTNAIWQNNNTFASEKFNLTSGRLQSDIAIGMFYLSFADDMQSNEGTLTVLVDNGRERVYWERVNNRKMFIYKIHSRIHCQTPKKGWIISKLDALNVLRLQCDKISMLSLQGKMHQPLNKCTVAYCISMHKIWAIKMPEHLATLVDVFFFLSCRTHSLRWNIFVHEFVFFHHFLIYTPLFRALSSKSCVSWARKKLPLQKSLLRSMKRWFRCKIQHIIASCAFFF